MEIIQNYANIFVLKQFKMVKIKKYATGLNRGLQSNYMRLRCVNHMKSEECAQKIIIYCSPEHDYKYRLTTTSLSRKDSQWCGTNFLSSNEKVLCIAVCKKGHVDSLLGYKTTHHY